MSLLLSGGQFYVCLYVMHVVLPLCCAISKCVADLVYVYAHKLLAELTLIKVAVTMVAHISLNLQLPPYRGMNDWYTAGATPLSAPLHIIAHGPHGLSQQCIKTANT